MENIFGFKKNIVLSMETNLSFIESASKAKVNIVLNQEALAAAKLLQERVNTPFVFGYPIGNHMQAQWLSKVGETIGIDYNVDSVTTANIEGENVFIYAGYDKAQGLSNCVKSLGCKNVDLVCSHKIKKSENIRYLKTEKEKIEMFKSLNDSIVFGDSTFLQFVNDSNKKIAISPSASLLKENFMEDLFTTLYK